MASTHPYLIRAIYDWANDQNLTPYLVADTTIDGVKVPEAFIQDNAIVLNIAPSAVRDLSLGDEFVAFSARFAGVAHDVFVPVTAVRAVYAKENGEGVILPAGEGGAVASSANTEDAGSIAPETGDKPGRGKKPHLTIVE